MKISFVLKKIIAQKNIYIYPCTIFISRKIPNRNSWKQKRANIFTRKLTRKNNDTILLSPKREKKRKRKKSKFQFPVWTRTRRDEDGRDGLADVVHVTRLSPEVAVSRTGQHSSVILPIIYFHPLKRPRLRLQSGLPAALPFTQESRERLHSGDNRVPFHFSKGSPPLACSGHCLAHGR